MMEDAKTNPVPQKDYFAEWQEAERRVSLHVYLGRNNYGT